MATASRKPPEMGSQVDFEAAQASRLQSIENVWTTEMAELEASTTRAHNAKAKARAVAESEFQAERLERNATVVSETQKVFRDAWAAYVASHDLGRAQALALHWRNRNAEHLRLLGRPLGRELAVVAVEDFASKHPETLGRFANIESWTYYGLGIDIAVSRAAAAFAIEFDTRGQQDAALALESAVGRIGTAPGLSAVSDEDAPELWKIIADCPPPDVAEARRQDHAKRAKARSIEASQAEQQLQYAAVTGNKEARATIAARGAGALDALFAQATNIIHRVTGRQPLEQEVRQYLLGEPH